MSLSSEDAQAGAGGAGGEAERRLGEGGEGFGRCCKAIILSEMGASEGFGAGDTCLT